MTDQLSDNERLLLARENAADNHVRGQWYAADERGAFVAGWDAAMEYMKEQSTDMREAVRLLTTLNWCVGYELGHDDQLTLDRAQELALKAVKLDHPQP